MYEIYKVEGNVWEPVTRTIKFILGIIHFPEVLVYKQVLILSDLPLNFG